MALHETSGIVLKTYTLADADKIVIFLTPQFGLMRGVAKGAKRLKSRFGGSLEPFTEVNIEFYQKEDRELVSIRQIELEKSYFEVIGNPVFLREFSYLAELLIEFIPAQEANERIYRMTKVCLETASENPENLEITTFYFELWLLKLGGYLPSWERCENCEQILNDKEDANLQIDFRLLCSRCRPGKSQSPVNSEQRAVFQTAQKLSPENFLKFAKEKNAAVKEVSFVLKRIISHITGKEFKSIKISASAN